MSIETGFWVRNYKSFKGQGGGFKSIKSINIIIGKNNIGKSSLLDALDYMFRGRGGESDYLGGSIEFTEKLSEQEIRGEFSGTTSGGDIPGNHWGYGKKFVDQYLTWKEVPSGAQYVSCTVDAIDAAPGRLEKIASRTKRNRGKYHIRLDADRDLVPESPESDPALARNGVGGTNIIQMYINRSDYNRSIIQAKLLSALNEIFRPDITFSEIIVQLHLSTNKWEVYLAEGGKDPFPLSSSGSGLKTVILTLLNLLVRPSFEGRNIAEYVFSFEELENNLHPALQRNLFAYLLGFAKANECHIFLTTHSQVAIDLFHGESDAQIIHVKKQGDEVVGNLLEHFGHGYSVLDDLGAKASDILQANGIIWVEGPSDRVFLNKLIDIYGGGRYLERQHYQFIFYGGSVLANISADIPADEVQEAISAFRVNRNFVFVCDSDRRSSNGRLKSRVTELLGEVAGTNGYIWITRCKEIENYIPKEAFEAVYGVSGLPQIGEYEYVQDFLRSQGLSKASEYRDKHHNAVRFAEHFSEKNLEFRPEIHKEMGLIIAKLADWNS